MRAVHPNIEADTKGSRVCEEEDVGTVYILVLMQSCQRSPSRA